VVAKVKALAERKGCTPAQFALAWVLAQGDDLVPIPGTKRRRYLDENIGALDVVITQEDKDEIDRILPPGVAAGMRYPAQMMAALNH
jgi:aryl-alcohol dehydrogenase-like predicted oxidoreductase